MREKFPFKRPGDTLSAEEVNLLSSSVRGSSAGREGGGQFGFRGSFGGSAADQAHLEMLVVVTSETVDDQDTAASGRYLCQSRYYDHETSLWKDGDVALELDVRGFSWSPFNTLRGLVLLPCDVLTVRYDEQRGLCVPVDPPTERRAVAQATIAVGEFGSAEIHDDCGATGRTVQVRNATGAAVASGSVVRLVYLRDSSCYELRSVTTSASVTSTTTTTGIGAVSECSGKCRWVWSAATATWGLDSDECAGSSTTSSPTTTTDPGSSSSSSSTTSTSTTTTTCCPFSAARTASSTTSSPTTTTGGGNCQCLYPTFCGGSDGDCTFTQCALHTNQPTDCSWMLEPTSTSTTTTSWDATSTTTTSCDCNTTTTAAPEPQCVAGCDWKGVPYGADWHWVKVFDGCGGNCPCPFPTDNPYCNSAHTDCTPIVKPPPPPPPPTCNGGCLYWWVPQLDSWVLTNSSCSTYPGCRCVPPSAPGSVCAPVTVPCVAPTTTSAPSTTTAHPCANCYTSSTTSTTTTTPMCSGECRWNWSTVSQTWSLVYNSCEPECPCLPPPTFGTADCEVTQSPCGAPPTTTTTSSTSTSSTSTSSTSTSSTSTSSTTTTAPCTGVCLYYCQPTGGGLYEWHLLAGPACTGSDPNCGCQAPCEPCTAENLGATGGGCSNTTCPPTTTTTSSTSTSSTTTTQPWWCDPYIGHSCEDGGVCGQGPAEFHQDACSGPYATVEDCIANCPSGITSSTTTTSESSPPTSSSTATTATS